MRAYIDYFSSHEHVIMVGLASQRPKLEEVYIADDRPCNTDIIIGHTFFGRGFALKFIVKNGES